MGDNMNLLRKTWEDLRNGDNIDLYLVVIVSVTVALLGLFDVASQELLWFSVPAVLALLTTTVLQNQFRRRTQKTIAEAEAKVEAQPEKVKPAWDLARVTLEAYFSRNLSQISAIFWLSVFVMVTGFGIIVWGISQAVQSPNALLPAIISTATGVVTEFIGATFLFVYRSTIQQAMDYSRTLERINSVGMAMQILDTIPDETSESDLKSKTKAELVKLLVQKAHEPDKGSKTISNSKESTKS